MYSLVLGGSDSWHFVKLHFSGKFKILKIDEGVNLIFCFISNHSSNIVCFVVVLLICYFAIML